MNESKRPGIKWEGMEQKHSHKNCTKALAGDYALPNFHSI